MPDERVASTIRQMTDSAAHVRDAAVYTQARVAAFGRTIAVHYPRHADNASIPLDRAFLGATPEDPPYARVTLIDAVLAGPPPSITWPQDMLGPFGALPADDAEGWAFAVDNETKSLLAFNPESRDAVTWCRDVSALPYWARATPFRIPLSWIAHRFEAEMIHAAGVVVDDRAVLLLGPGGAGKSTLALASAQTGLPLLGDDFLMVSGLTAQAVYRRVKLHDASVRALAGGPPIGSILNADAPEQKRILDLEEALLRVDETPIGALVVPRVAARASLSRLRGAEFLRRVVYPSMQGLLGGSATTVKVLAHLARRVPAYSLDVGPDLVDNVRAVTRIAEDARLRESA